MKRLVVGVVVAGVLTAASSIPTSLVRAGNSASAQQVSPTRAPGPNDIVQTAKQYLGSPYAYIGNTPAGFSCIGFVNFVFHQNGVFVPFDTDQAWATAPHVDRSQLAPGDVLFFSNTVFAGLSHVAIYIGGGQMIGADSYAVGVTTDQVDDPYWVAHYTGATRPLALLGTSPMPGTAPVATQAATPVPTAAPLVANAPVGSWLQPSAAAINLYSGPGYEYTAVATLGQSGMLYVVQSQGAWYNVRTPKSLYGWVSAGSVHVSKLVTPRPASTPVLNQGLSYASAVAARPGSVLYVAVGPLWVRSGPSKSFGSVGFVRVGTPLSVTQTEPHWVRVSAPGGIAGWVATQYLSATRGAAANGDVVADNSATAPTTALTVRVTAPALNVRAQPDSHAHVVSVLFSGETVQVIAQRSGWNEVRLRNGSTGWAAAQYLKKV